MKSLPIYIVSLLALLATTACHKKELVELDRSRITVTAYWDLAELQPQNATLLIYDTNGNLYQEARVASRKEFAQFDVTLPVGRYTLVVFNELRDQIDHVGIRGWENLQTLEAYSLPNDKPLFAFENTENLTQQPGILATANRVLEITPDMATDNYNSGISTLVTLHPDRKTARSNITIDVQGLNNALMPAATQLRNLASSYFFATDRNSLTPTAIQFPTGNRSYLPGSTTDGTISTSITTFGVLGEWHHTADTPHEKVFINLAFILNDPQRTLFEVEQDITDAIEIRVNTKLQITLDINLQTPPLPNVTPGGGGDNENGSGFDAEITDWDKVVIPLPI